MPISPSMAEGPFDIPRFVFSVCNVCFMWCVVCLITIWEVTGLMERVWWVWCGCLLHKRPHCPLLHCSLHVTHPCVSFFPGHDLGATEMAQGEHLGVGRAARRTNWSGLIIRGPGAAQILTVPTAIWSLPWPRQLVLVALRCWLGATAHPVAGVSGSCPKQVVSTEQVYVLWHFWILC